MTRRAAKRIPAGGEPMHPSNRHPLGQQPEPAEDGGYMVCGFPGDDWRLMCWSHGRFTVRGWLHAQRWWRWLTVEDYEARRAERSVPCE